MTDKPAHDHEFAREELQRFADAMDVLLTDPDGKEPAHVARIVDLIARGCMVVSEDGETLTYTLQRKGNPVQSVTFHEATGANLKTLDGDASGKGDQKRLQAFTAAITKQAPATISKCKAKDVGAMTDIALLFL